MFEKPAGYAYAGMCLKADGDEPLSCGRLLYKWRMGMARVIDSVIAKSKAGF